MKRNMILCVLTAMLVLARITVAQDHFNMTLIGEGGATGYADVALDGDLVAVARLHAVTLYDISDMARPLWRASIPCNSTAFKVALHSGFLFVLTSQLHLYDIATSATPRLIASCPISPAPSYSSDCSLQITENAALLATQGTLTLFDWADRINLHLLSTTTVPGSFITDLAVSGSSAYLACQRTGVVRMDISDLSAPKEVCACVTGGYANGLAARGHLLFLADGNGPAAPRGLRIFDTARPDTLLELAFIPTPGDAWMITLDGNYAYLSDRPGIRIFDITDVLHPSELPIYSGHGGWYNAMHISGDKAAADYATGVSFLDLADPATLVLKGAVGGGGPCTGFAVACKGNQAFLADKDNGIRIIDCWDPTNPFDGYQFDTPGTAYWLALAGDLAYVADGAAGLRAVDISNPSTWAEKGLLDTPGSCEKVTIADHFAYVADGTSGMRIIDIQNPAAMKEIGSFDSPARVTGCAVDGNQALITDYTKGVRLLDISNPSAPTEIGSYDTPGTAWDAVLTGTMAYVADGGKGLRILDLTNPQAITETGYYDITGGNSTHLILEPPLIYLADGDNGVRVIDVSAPAAPVEVAWYNTAGTINGLAKSDSLIVVADGSAYGMKILHLDYQTGIAALPPQQPADFSLAQNYPNPFNSSTEISFTLGRAGTVRLEIFDLLGRKVVTLVDGNLPPGLHRSHWEATGYPSGIYFCRLSAQGRMEKKQLLVVR